MTHKVLQSQNKATLAELVALRDQMESVELGPGERHVTSTPTLISTVLGSCVSVCLYSPERKVGAMCHCVLPSRKRTGAYHDNPDCCVDSCIERMVEDFTRHLKVPRSAITAKLFGGANVLQTGTNMEEATVGQRNIEAARQALQDHDLPVVTECVGGDHGYKIFFNTETGEVFLRRVKNTRLDCHEIPPHDLH